MLSQCILQKIKSNLKYNSIVLTSDAIVVITNITTHQYIQNLTNQSIIASTLPWSKDEFARIDANKDGFFDREGEAASYLCTAAGPDGATWRALMEPHGGP